MVMPTTTLMICNWLYLYQLQPKEPNSEFSFLTNYKTKFQLVPSHLKSPWSWNIPSWEFLKPKLLLYQEIQLTTRNIITLTWLIMETCNSFLTWMVFNWDAILVLPLLAQVLLTSLKPPFYSCKVENMCQLIKLKSVPAFNLLSVSQCNSSIHLEILLLKTLLLHSPLN